MSDAKLQLVPDDFILFRNKTTNERFAFVKFACIQTGRTHQSALLFHFFWMSLSRTQGRACSHIWKEKKQISFNHKYIFAKVFKCWTLNPDSLHKCYRLGFYNVLLIGGVNKNWRFWISPNISLWAQLYSNEPETYLWQEWN